MPVQEKRDLPQQDLPAAAIPNLKKKQKERKKAGAAWGTGKVAGSFSGEEGAVGARAPTGVARAAASAASALEAGALAEAGAAAEAGFFANLLAQAGAIFSDITATLLGKVAVAVAVALAAGLAALGGYRLLHGSHNAAGDSSLPDMGGISSSIRVPRDGANGLGYSPSGQGLIRFSGPGKQSAAPKSEEPPKDETAGLPADGAGSVELRNGMPLDRMAHNLSGSKLSSGLGGQFGAGGGGAMGNAKLPNFGAQNGALGQYGASSAASGKGGTLQAKSVQGALGNSLRHLSASASRSLALLRGMASKYNPPMRAGGNTANETNSQAGTTQWESSENSGASAPTSPTDQSPAGGAAEVGVLEAAGGQEAIRVPPPTSKPSITRNATTKPAPIGTAPHARAWIPTGIT